MPSSSASASKRDAADATALAGLVGRPCVSVVASKVLRPKRFMPVLSITCTLSGGDACGRDAGSVGSLLLALPRLPTPRVRSSSAVSAESTTISMAYAAQ
jgi:hypothetical protein